MFEQSIVVNSPEMRRRKRLAALISVAVETAAVGAALTVPLFTGKALPPVDPPVGPPTYYAPPKESVKLVPPPEPNQPFVRQAINVLTQPSRIPMNIDMTADKRRAVGPSSEPGIEAPPGWIPVGTSDGIDHRIAGTFVPPPLPAREPEQVVFRPRTSSIMEGLLIRRVTPVYPPLARASRVEGTVVLQAMITRSGTIERLEIVSGHPMLCGAAADAVMQWRYRPYLLNGQAVEVNTEIRVNFVLGGAR